MGLGVVTGRLSHDSVERLPDGREFNRDTGTLDLLELQLRWPLQARALRLGTRTAWQGGLAWRHEAGRLAYRGLGSLGVPLVSRTRLERERLSLWVERRLGTTGQVAPAWSSSLGLALVTEWTSRGIAATPLSVALDERHTRHELALQASAGLPLGRGGVALQARWQGGWAWAQQFRAEAGASLDPVQLRPHGGERHEWALGLRWQPGGAAWALELAHAGRRERVGASNAVPATALGRPAGTVRYPGSRNRGQGWQLGWQMRLD